jgi:hypothetical protein|tara:strand:+ start:4732 stop:5181 length:450 start_codon:yes stop_codon:yes gene_type:complete
MRSLQNLRKHFGEIEIIKEGEWYMPNIEELKKFDIDLAFGEKGEDFVRNVLQGNGKIEVKTERDKWKDTGNIAIEIRCNGNLSGLSATESKTWVQLLSVDDNIIGGFIFNTDYLKKTVKKTVTEGKAKIVKGGDFNASQMVLLPIKELF